jgi:hypothetical protein
VPPARTIRNAAILGGLGLAAVYAFEAAQYRRVAGKGYQLQDPPTPGTADFARLVETLTVTPLRQGNRVTVLRNGREIFPAMLAAIQHAKQTVNFATYVYWTARSRRSSPRRSPSGRVPVSRSTSCWTRSAPPRWTTASSTSSTRPAPRSPGSGRPSGTACTS